ncbi:hypothetical protein FNV43_RR01621 [Rhamnella rubrinervis]|uniref:Uncharacterized protein n=1 Tax=Rhamnella rubrinervis TaxID=2594499 RepID=A0A8K0MTG7_9ROSA|nr:hypothetical protein FNV43_RR01621 [Rhamnella rubrinervis]
MVRQRPARSPTTWWPPEFQKFRDGGIFPKGVARFWDPRDDGWQCSTEHGTGSHRDIGWVLVGSQCARGSEGMLVAAVVLRCLFGVGIILDSSRHPMLAMGLGTWGACGLGFENSSGSGNLSIACCGINGGLA